MSLQKKLTSPRDHEYLFSVNKDSILGSGAFGVVYKGTDAKTQEKVAIKRVCTKGLKPSDKFMQYLGNEANILQEMENQKSIVAILDCFQTHEHLNIVMEYCDGGTLKEKLAKNGNAFTEEEALNYFEEIVEGLYAMHKIGRMHRDLKLANIFFKEDRCKIGDFGFATRELTSSTVIGTPEYMAPEILECEKGGCYNHQVDIWSLGIMLHKLLFNDPLPFIHQQKNLKDILQAIKATPYHLPAQPLISDFTKKLLMGMIFVEPKSRFLIDDIKDLLAVRTEFISLITQKFDNYRKCCMFFLTFCVSFLPEMKKKEELAFDEGYLFCCSLLSLTHKKLSFLIHHFDLKECPKNLFKPTEVPYLSMFSELKIFQRLKTRTIETIKLVQKRFSDLIKTELPQNLKRGGNAEHPNIETYCTADFEKLLRQIKKILFQMINGNSEIQKFYFDLELIQEIQTVMDGQNEIDFDSFEKDCNNFTITYPFDFKKYVKS